MCNYETLSNDIALFKYRHGWTHHDIICLTHLVPYSPGSYIFSCFDLANNRYLYDDEFAEQILLSTYLWSGISEVSKVKDLPEGVLDKITNADSLKKCHNFAEASTLITKMNNLKVSLLPVHLLRSRKDNSEVNFLNFVIRLNLYYVFIIKLVVLRFGKLSLSESALQKSSRT